MDLAFSIITLGAQTSEGDDRTDKPILEMRRLLASHCRGPYSPEIREFALILRVGGEMQEFDFEGCDRIRRNRKEQYITVDLGFPSGRWKGATDAEIRAYLAEAVETGLLCCIRRLEKDKTPVDSDKLMSDFRKAKQLFLAGVGSTQGTKGNKRGQPEEPVGDRLSQGSLRAERNGRNGDSLTCVIIFEHA
jgi:hypothetical protein